MSEAPRAALLCAAAWLAGLAGTGAALRALAPVPPVPGISDPLRRVCAPGANYTTIVFGSSKTRGGFVPELFDAEMARRGETERSFNFGAETMALPESAYLCEQVLARRPAGLRRLLVELSPARVRIPSGLSGTPRLRYWHDWRRTLLVSRALLHAGAPLFTPDPQLLGRTPAGVLAEHLGGFLPCGEFSLEAPQAIPEENYHAYAGTMTAAAVGAWLRPQAPPSRDLLAEAAYRDLHARAKAAGVRLVVFAFPDAPSRRQVFAGAPGPGDPPVLALDRPAEYPALYAPENRASEVHLNDRGARAFTCLLAELLDGCQDR